MASTEYFKNNKITVRNYMVEARYVIDVILPNFRKSIQEAQVNFSLYVQLHFKKFWEDAIIELLKIYNYIKFKKDFVLKLYDDFSEYVTIDNDLYKEGITFEFECLLLEAKQTIAELEKSIETDVLSMRNYMNKGAKNEIIN